MKYMLQIRFNGADAAISKLSAGEQQAISSEFEEIGRLTGVLDGNQLEHAGTAKTVSVRDGRPHAIDGPAVDLGAALDGYYIYEAPDVEAATALAARIPATRLGATVEIRPVVER
jgi:hypothetical protein